MANQQQSNILGVAEQSKAHERLIKLASGKKLSAVVWAMLLCGILQIVVVAALILMSSGAARKDELFFLIPMFFTFILAGSAYTNSRMNAQKMLSAIGPRPLTNVETARP